MAERPDFGEITSYKEFASYYWYRAELAALCRKAVCFEWIPNKFVNLIRKDLPFIEFYYITIHIKGLLA